jgi:hypothetical protein
MTTMNDRPKRNDMVDVDELPQPGPYDRPRLTAYGDLRGLTLGSSPGAGDSGSPGTRLPLLYYGPWELP